MQIEPSGKGKTPIKRFLTDSIGEQNSFERVWKIIICSFISFLSLQLNEFLQSEKKQNPAIADKKIISVFCVFGVLCSPFQSAVHFL